MAYKMVTKKYEGAIFDNGQITKELMDLLNSRNILIEIQSDIQSPNDSRPVVIGVPHHAAIGQEKIAEEAQERPSDEAAAYYALSVFNYLKSCVPCKLVIAAHSTDHNPNKQNDSPYFNSIFELNPRLLFECHGAGSTRKHDLELSSGIALCSDIRRFGLRFSRRLLDGIVFACQVIPGEKMKSCILYEKGKAEKAGELVFPALGTLSLVMAKCKNIPAFHLEARPSFRFDEANPGRLTQQGEWLGKTIAQMILEYLEFENYAHYIRDIPHDAEPMIMIELPQFFSNLATLARIKKKNNEDFVLLKNFHPDWAEKNDVRWSCFQRIDNILNAAQLAFSHSYNEFIRERCWGIITDSSDPMPGMRHFNLITYLSVFKVGFIHSFISAIENMMRILLREKSPGACKNGVAEFKSIYSCLLRKLLGFSADMESLLDVARLIRNTIHNNGAHFDQEGKDEVIVYHENKYEFRHGCPITFADWHTIFCLFEDLRNLLFYLVTDPEISLLPCGISDPFNK